MARTKQIKVTVTEEEYAALQAEAADYGIPVATLIYQKAMRNQVNQPTADNDRLDAIEARLTALEAQASLQPPVEPDPEPQPVKAVKVASKKQPVKAAPAKAKAIAQDPIDKLLSYTPSRVISPLSRVDDRMLPKNAHSYDLTAQLKQALTELIAEGHEEIWVAGQDPDDRWKFVEWDEKTHPKESRWELFQYPYQTPDDQKPPDMLYERFKRIVGWA